MKPNKPRKKILQHLCDIYSTYSVFLWLGVAFYLTRARPTETEPSRGFVYPMPAHGPPVYISLFDAFVLVGIPVAAIIAAIVYRRLDKK